MQTILCICFIRLSFADVIPGSIPLLNVKNLGTPKHDSEIDLILDPEQNHYWL